MTTTRLYRTRLLTFAAPVAVLFALSSLARAEMPIELSLDGAAQVPPVSTSATGSGQVTLQDDRLLKGSVDVSGIEPTMAHIHEAATGENGPPIITLVKDDDNTFSVPQGTKLTEAQYKSFLAGKLYVNVHSAEHPDGELRAQLIVSQ
jgi:hypothetical protein